MAQAQLVRQIAVQKQEQEQQIKQEQSFQLVQTLLAASIGSLAFLRGLFPEECFIKFRYLPEHAESYRAFSNGKPSTSGRWEHGMTITRLQRGVIATADKLLEFLERGVFKAIEDGYLKALQLGIYIDEEHPEVVLESYTFSFVYRNEDGVALRISNVAGECVAMNDASKEMRQIIRNLLVITQDLPALPGISPRSQ